MIKTNDSDPSIAIIKSFLSKAISFKYFYLVCLGLFITSAFLYNKYSRRVYEVSASVRPVQNNASTLLSSNELFRSIGSLQLDKNIEDEINNLKSFGLVNSTMTKMNLEVSYYTGENKLFKQTRELYGDSPFSVNIDKSHVQPIEAEFYILILNDYSFRIFSSQNKVTLYNYVDNLIVSEKNVLNIDTVCKFNETINNKFFKFSVSFHKENQPSKPNSEVFYYFKLHHLDFLSLEYMDKLVIKRVSPLASIINIKFRGENERKAISFLNKFLDTYLEENLTKKNKIALSTIDFIDSQISEISDSLVLSESKLKNFRSTNQVMDLSFQGKSIYDQLTQIDNERASLNVQERYYNYIINYFKTNNDISGVVPPSSMNVADPLMNSLIADLMALNSQRSNILSNNSEKNLFLGQIDNKIKIQKQAIIENVTNNLNTLSLSLNELNYRSDKLSREISQLPKTELSMVSMQRKFNLNDVIYTYLLQKRSEAAITWASNYPDFEIMERARESLSVMVAPKKKINLLIAIFFAFLIPSMYIIGKDLFNDTITSYHDIEHFLNRSIIGIIYSNNKKTESVVTDYPGTSISESFRNLRSNLFLNLKSEQPKVILVTSAQPRDGKSFISFNLAASIASVGYKTIIIDGDLRRPSLHIKFKEDNANGLSTYMINKATSNEILHSTSIENLFFIPAGPIMPNPAEMIESGVLDDLISDLKKEFEYVIIDTTPVGLVADASLLIKYASQILLVSRNNYTRKDIFANVIDNFNSKKIINFDVVFNDINLDKSPYKSYSNYYSNK
jgi:capsular exopolysaccharide synthesis family protein